MKADEARRVTNMALAVREIEATDLFPRIRTAAAKGESHIVVVKTEWGSSWYGALTSLGYKVRQEQGAAFGGPCGGDYVVSW